MMDYHSIECIESSVTYRADAKGRRFYRLANGRVEEISYWNLPHIMRACFDPPESEQRIQNSKRKEVSA